MVSYLLILDSLGSTELFFILVMALIFFGPRKLPQISRSLGKSLAEFRRASDDFKRTWEREVALESDNFEEKDTGQPSSESNSIGGVEAHESFPADPSLNESSAAAEKPESIEETVAEREAGNKRDWL